MSRQGWPRIEAGYLRAVTFVAAIALVSCSPAPQPATLAVTEAWARLPVVAGRPATAYFVIRGGPAPARLTGVTSSGTARIELHEGGMSGNMASMRPMDGIDVPARGSVSFAPGGNHAMIFGLDPKVAPGTVLPLTFRFADGRGIDVEARVLPADAPAPNAQN